MKHGHVNFLRKKISKKKNSSKGIPKLPSKSSKPSVKKFAAVTVLGLVAVASALLRGYIPNLPLRSEAGPSVLAAETKSETERLVEPELIQAKPVAQAPDVDAVQEPSALISELQAKNTKGIETIKKGQKGDVFVVLNSDHYFQVGTAKISDEKVIQLAEIADVLKTTAKEFGDKVALEIEGHTDDSPVVKQKHLYPSNWELSAARAASLVHLFEGAGFDKEKMKLVGYGDSRPVAPNRDPNGEPIVSNAIKNRRIVLRVYASENQMNSI